MFLLPYETTICATHDPERLTLALKRANIEYPFPAITTPAGSVLDRAVFITPRDEHVDVPPVTQFLNIGTADNPTLVIDGRPYMRYDLRNDTYRLTATSDYAFMCARVALTLGVLDEGVAQLGRLGDLTAKTFVRWITLTLARKYNLPLEQQLSLMVITAYYYFGLVDPSNTEDEEARIRLAPQVARVTGAPATAVLDIAARIDRPAYDANAFTQQITTKTGSLRFNDFKFIDLWTMLNTSWIGSGNVKETVGVALEHVPTWVAMVFSSLAERSYRRTVITQRAESAGRTSDRQQFVTLVQRLISDQYQG